MFDRMAYFSVLIFGVLAFCVYIGTLTSKSVASENDVPIKTLEDLLNSPLRLAIEQDLVIDDWLESARPGTVWNGLYNEKVKNDPRYT